MPHTWKLGQLLPSAHGAGAGVVPVEHAPGVVLLGVGREPGAAQPGPRTTAPPGPRPPPRSASGSATGPRPGGDRRGGAAAATRPAAATTASSARWSSPGRSARAGRSPPATNRSRSGSRASSLRRAGKVPSAMPHTTARSSSTPRARSTGPTSTPAPRCPWRCAAPSNSSLSARPKEATEGSSSVPSRSPRRLTARSTLSAICRSSSGQLRRSRPPEVLLDQLLAPVGQLCPGARRWAGVQVGVELLDEAQQLPGALCAAPVPVAAPCLLLVGGVMVGLGGAVLGVPGEPAPPAFDPGLHPGGSGLPLPRRARHPLPSVASRRFARRRPHRRVRQRPYRAV